MSRERDVVLIGNCAPDVSDAVRDVVRTLPGYGLSSYTCQTSIPATVKPSVLVYYHQCRQLFDGADEIIGRVTSSYPTTPLIVISGNDDPADRLHFIAAGAADCLLLPLDANRLAFLLDLLTVRERVQQQSAAASLARSAPVADEFLSNSSAMYEILEQIDRVATLPVTLLFTGKTGTGKTHLARHVHRIGPRAEDRFMVVDCGAIPSTLMESELFGHVRGAFTGASSDQKGKFEVVGAGTLLLDEIDALPWDTQTRLLRVVEDREFELLGSTKTKAFRGRLIVATNQNLEDAVAQGRFREDLFYRLNVVRFAIPPLRDRPEDIVALATIFLDKFAQAYRRMKLTLTDAACLALESYSWPGNVRELRNVMERACALMSSDVGIDIVDLPHGIRQSVPQLSENLFGDVVPRKGRQNKLAVARVDAERSRLVESIRRNSNNRSRVAMELGISRVTLYKKLRKFGLM